MSRRAWIESSHMRGEETREGKFARRTDEELEEASKTAEERAQLEVRYRRTLGGQASLDRIKSRYRMENVKDG